MEIVLISLGNFQEHILDNIKNLLLFKNLKITVITEKCFFPKINLNEINLIDSTDLINLNYKNKSKLNREFRNGFWFYCSYRFFVLYEYMNKYNIKDIIHLENDVISYINYDTLNFNKNKISVTFDCENRVIPGIIYIPNDILLKNILDNYNYNLNDMENLALVNDNIIESLPIIDNNIETFYKLNINFNKFKCIFDAAAIGQYLGGIDKKNNNNDTRGFINETCLINYSNYKFHWILEDKLYCPYIEINNKKIKIINLHIHSKELYKFIANHPIEYKYISLVNNNV
jgi:hypothetical protein